MPIQDRDYEQAKEIMEPHRERALEQWPHPLNFLVVQLMQRNTRNWLVEKTGTYGEKEVIEHGLTDNQYEWLSRLAAKLEGDHWLCPHCNSITVSETKPEACAECAETELQEANIAYDLKEDREEISSNE